MLERLRRLLRSLFARLLNLQSREVHMPAFKDLLTSVQNDLAVQATDATALASATAAKVQSDSDVSTSTVAFSSAVKGAPGGAVVDATGSVVTLYTSPDGSTYVATPIANITDTVPTPPPAS